MTQAPDPANFEKLGVFYLGRVRDAARNETTEELLLYDPKDLTTHAVCIGMTGSGKTGLCLTLLEEAALDGIPAIAIDPKGDLGNLALTFPDLAPSDFRPWVDDAEAARKGQTPSDYAASVASLWKDGLAKWGQDGARIRRLREAADIAIYTPGSSAGRALKVLKSFAAPPQAVAQDATALGERVNAAASGLLALLGVEADPIQSREHILLATLFQHAWAAGEDLDLAQLIQRVQTPPVERIGVMDLESFFPGKERFSLAMRLNGLLASPSFRAWLEGEPLDVQRLLWTPEAKPRVSILSIAHLSDAERMFFVTLLLNEILVWMRQQPGTPSLRAILYMDEILGYFPPTASPPSKTPMLTLLKQARAYGLGVVLATQNPVDLDYKGLANAGTWFLGRLQTERDKARVLEGLEGASRVAGGVFDRAEYERVLSGLGSRIFLMNNVHDDVPVVFETRWAMSYLRGPLTSGQIQRITSDVRGAERAASPAPGTSASETSGRVATPDAAPAAASPRSHDPTAGGAAGLPSTGGSSRPVVPAEAREKFASITRPGEGRVVYRGALFGVADLHFVKGSALDLWQTRHFVALLSRNAGADVWSSATPLEAMPPLASQPEPGAAFAELPAGALNAKMYGTWEKSFATYLYQSAPLELFACPALKLAGRPGESAADLKVRVRETLRAERSQALEKLKAKYAAKLAQLQRKLQHAEDRLGRERAQFQAQGVQTAISVGATVLGALLGRKTASVGTIGRATTAARGATRAAREREDIARAELDKKAAEQELARLEAEFQAETSAYTSEADPSEIEILEETVSPRKSDITVRSVSLAWLPTRVDGTGTATDAWR
jgi:hypothetical protein